MVTEHQGLRDRLLLEYGCGFPQENEWIKNTILFTWEISFSCFNITMMAYSLLISYSFKLFGSLLPSTCLKRWHISEAPSCQHQLPLKLNIAFFISWCIHYKRNTESGLPKSRVHLIFIEILCLGRIEDSPTVGTIALFYLRNQLWRDCAMDRWEKPRGFRGPFWFRCM